MLLLEGCNVNDATVQVLAQNCMLLREVSIKGSLGCSDKSADVLLQVVPFEFTLNFIFCSRLTYADVSALLLPPLFLKCASQPRYFVTLAAELPATPQIGHAWVQCHYEGQQRYPLPPPPHLLLRSAVEAESSARL